MQDVVNFMKKYFPHDAGVFKKPLTFAAAKASSLIGLWVWVRIL